MVEFTIVDGKVLFDRSQANTLRKLAERKLIRWHDRACEVLDVKGLMEIAGWEGLPERRRPLI